MRAIESRVQKLSFAAGVIHEAKSTVWYSNEQYSTTTQYVQIGPSQCVKIQELGSAAGMSGKKIEADNKLSFPEERNCQIQTSSELWGSLSRLQFDMFLNGRSLPPLQNTYLNYHATILYRGRLQTVKQSLCVF